MTVIDQPALQRRTLGVLSTAQVLSGVGVASGVAAGSLIVADLSGSEGMAGLAQTAGVLGAAVAASPLGALSNRVGRRPSLALGYSIGALGALVVIVSASAHFLPTVLLGTFLVGAATAAGLQGRYAATDLAQPSRVGFSLSVVVWATTIGAVVGPNLLSPASHVADHLGLLPLTGPYLVTMAALATGAVVVWTLLRPDPLVTERALRGVAEQQVRVTLAEVRSVLRGNTGAVLGIAAMAIGYVVMVMVMVMTPVHMQHVDATLTLIGLVISVHIVGMYAFSPLVGWLTDRYGPLPAIWTGVVILGAATLLAGTAPDMDFARLGLGLFLLGLGWSFTLVAGSALITESVDDAERPGVQGFGDTVMNGAAAVGGVVAGIVVMLASYGWLNAVAAACLLPLVALLLRQRRLAVRPA
jgi:MFS family permease